MKTDKFKNKFQNLEGLAFPGGNSFLMMLNTDAFNENTIIHEIYHILQKSSNSFLNLSKIDEIKISSLQLNEDDLKYLYNEYEFEAHVKINLVNQLNEIYYKFYKDWSKSRFIETFLVQCENNPTSIYENEFIDKILFNCKIKHDDLTSIRLFLSTFLIKNKNYNNLALKWLRESF